MTEVNINKLVVSMPYTKWNGPLIQEIEKELTKRSFPWVGNVTVDYEDQASRYSIYSDKKNSKEVTALIKEIYERSANE